MTVYEQCHLPMIGAPGANEVELHWIGWFPCGFLPSASPKPRPPALATLSQLRRALASPAELRPDGYSRFCLPNPLRNPRPPLKSY